MNLIITSIFLVLLAKDVRSEECQACKSLYLDSNEIDFSKECGSDSQSKSCIVKCCARGQAIHFSNAKKIRICKTFDQLEMDFNLTQSLKDKLNTYSRLIIFKKDGNISSNTLFNDFKLLHTKKFVESYINYYGEDKTVLSEDGSAVFKQEKFDSIVAPTPQFCVDALVGTSKGQAVVNYGYFLYNSENDKKNYQKRKVRNSILAYGNLISAFFSLLALAVYGLLKQLHGKLHNMLFMAFIGSHMLFAVFFAGQLILQHVVPDFNETETFSYCKWAAPIIYFFLLSTFFWMNTMAFDIWWTFRYAKNYNNLPYWLQSYITIESDELLLVSRSVRRESHRRQRSLYVKFLYYALYAWGLPAVLTGIAVALENAKNLPDNVYSPNFAVCRTSDSNHPIKRLYVDLPLAFVVFTNIVFFLMTIYNIWSVGRSLFAMESASSNTKKNSQISIFMKLSIVMGISWILEFVQHQGSIDDELDIWWFVLINFWNSCLGLVLFFVMVFKLTNFVMLCQRFNIDNRWTRQSASTRTQTSKVSKSTLNRTQSNKDRMEIDSMPADPPKNNKQNPLENPRFTVSSIPDPVY